jgi:hypothetical protein
MPLEDIPTFLKLSPEERKAAWDEHRAKAKPLPPEIKTLPPILSPPGATNADTDA